MLVDLGGNMEVAGCFSNIFEHMIGAHIEYLPFPQANDAGQVLLTAPHNQVVVERMGRCYDIKSLRRSP